MSDIEKLVKIQQLLREIDSLLTEDFTDRINDRIQGIDWDGDYGNTLDFMEDDISYWYSELSSVQQDIEDFPDEI